MKINKNVSIDSINGAYKIIKLKTYKLIWKKLAILVKNGYNINMNIRDNREWEQIPLSNFWNEGGE